MGSLVGGLRMHCKNMSIAKQHLSLLPSDTTTMVLAFCCAKSWVDVCVCVSIILCQQPPCIFFHCIYLQYSFLSMHFCMSLCLLALFAPACCRSGLWSLGRNSEVYWRPWLIHVQYTNSINMYYIYIVYMQCIAMLHLHAFATSVLACSQIFIPWKCTTVFHKISVAVPNVNHGDKIHKANYLLEHLGENGSTQSVGINATQRQCYSDSWYMVWQRRPLQMAANTPLRNPHQDQQEQPSPRSWCCIAGGSKKKTHATCYGFISLPKIARRRFWLEPISYGAQMCHWGVKRSAVELADFIVVKKKVYGKGNKLLDW